MGFDEGRHTTEGTDRVLPSNQRRAFLEVLHQVIKETQPRLRSAVVLRAGSPILFVFNSFHVAHCADIGCDFDRTHGWVFTWAPSACPIVPVVRAHEAATEIARILRVEGCR
ncbi:hypothetical protein EBO15_26265 [Actinomadura harenae]|uniref:Uncharacterized protein n=2 Tax=Actinomadura harenae TaxID=2483351 RepID=A0A3M2LSP9_9ACTN|nr:hypothetical protein EBO15_26265 [Actinomadura harenae]